MDVTGRLVRFGAGRPHVLVVAVPGGTAARLAVEAELARRGWPGAVSPADADVLAVAGAPGPRLGEVVEQVWRQVPAPRVAIHVADAGGAATSLAAAAAALPASCRDRCAGPGSPGDVSMAGTGDDRDGLTLDRVHVPLGPVLPDWPAGLVVHLTLQGDVVQEARAEVLDGAGADTEVWAGRAAARELDALARFLGVAGWDDAAARARRLRDESLGAGEVPDRARVRLLVVRVRRSRVLRRLVRGLPAGAVDVAALLERRLAAVEKALDDPHAACPAPDLEALAATLVGADLAGVRLIVAGLGPDTEATPVEAAADVADG